MAATFLVINSLTKVFFSHNFKKLASLVYYGELDLVLVKPLSSQFYVSLREFSWHTLLRFLMGCSVLLVVATSSKIEISFLNFALFLAMLVFSIVIVYSLWFMSLNLVFWLGNISNIYEFFHPILRLTVIPLDILPPILKHFFFFVFPLAFVITIPVKTLLGLISWPTVFYGIFISLFLLFLSHKVWQFNLKHYSSASS